MMLMNYETGMGVAGGGVAVGTAAQLGSWGATAAFGLLAGLSGAFAWVRYRRTDPVS